jgi:hypothetical protein
MTPEILRHVRRYITGEISRREFEDWFVPATWNLSASNTDPSTVALSEQIYLALAEADNGHLDEAELIDRLAELESAAARPEAGARRGQ